MEYDILLVIGVVCCNYTYDLIYTYISSERLERLSFL